MISKLFSVIFRVLPQDKIERIVRSLINRQCKNKSPKEAISYLMRLDNYLYIKQGELAIRYGDGVHTKHKHMQYHDFFVRNVTKNDRVLEIGCGYGALAYSVASESECKELLGVDILEKNIEKATRLFKLPNLNFVVGDATSLNFSNNYDVVILSNVLEHTESRVKFLEKIKSSVEPKRIIIRVPLFERDWRVPLKKELGIEYRLDNTHFIEYSIESFTDEIEQSGYEVVHCECRWGEIWAIVK